MINIEDTFSLIEELNRGNGVAVALFSVPEYIQLKANKHYLNTLQKYFNVSEHSMGRALKDFMPHWEESKSKEVWDSAVNKKETFYCGE